MNDVNQIITKHIRNQRNTKGLKYKWLAEALGISQSNLSHKLAKNGLYASELLILAALLDIDLNELVSEAREVGENKECILKD